MRAPFRNSGRLGRQFGVSSRASLFDRSLQWERTTRCNSKHRCDGYQIFLLKSFERSLILRRSNSFMNLLSEYLVGGMICHLARVATDPPNFI
jgi:hypothetical protein